MIKSELIETISKRMTHLAEHTVEEAINLILECMTLSLVKGQRIEIRDFGSFSVHQMPSRKAHNPKTGESICVVPKNKVQFKPGLELKRRLIEARDLISIEL